VIDADSVLDGILGFVRRHRITQCVVGEPLRPAWREVLRGSVVNRLVRQASQVDIHVIARR
jgi:two-component system sensor histidine kinase KdpD